MDYNQRDHYEYLIWPYHLIPLQTRMYLRAPNSDLKLDSQNLPQTLISGSVFKRLSVTHSIYLLAIG